MLLRFRAFAFTLLSGIATSAVLLLAEGFTEMTWQEFSHVMTPHGFLNYVGDLYHFVLPATFPITLVGGCIAGWVVGRQQHPRPLKSWIGRCCFGGCALAAVGSVLSYRDHIYAVKSAFGLTEMLKFISHISLVFGVAGTFVGAAVGTYCWYAIRELPPNPPLNPTVAKSAPAG